MAEPRIGENIRRARRARGMTLRAVAELIGRSHSWLSMVENGHITVDSMSAVADIAEALRVSADDLLGMPARLIQAGIPSASLVRLQTTLMDTALDDPGDVPTRGAAELAAVAVELNRAMCRADYDMLAVEVPRAVEELQVLANGPQVESALRTLVRVSATAACMARHHGQTQLAWIAADRGWQAAHRLADPVAVGEAAFWRAHSQMSPNRGRALARTPEIADTVQPYAGASDHNMAVYGMLRLSAGLACQVRGDYATARDHLAEATTLAARVDDDQDAWELWGPTNAGLWGISLAVDSGHPEDALTIADGLDPARLPSRSRRAALHVELGKAYAATGRPDLAVEEIVEAERCNPYMVRYSPMVRDVVGALRERARSAAVSRELRGLAWRLRLD